MLFVDAKNLFCMLGFEIESKSLTWSRFFRRLGRHGRSLVRQSKLAFPNPSADSFFDALASVDLTLNGCDGLADFTKMLDMERVSQGLKHRDVARRARTISETMSHSTIWRVLCGVVKPRLMTLLLVSWALNIEPSLEPRAPSAANKNEVLEPDPAMLSRATPEHPEPRETVAFEFSGMDLALESERLAEVVNPGRVRMTNVTTMTVTLGGTRLTINLEGADKGSPHVIPSAHIVTRAASEQRKDPGGGSGARRESKPSVQRTRSSPSTPA
jgi:hypothetical protein